MYDQAGLQQYTALAPLVFPNSKYLFLVSMPSVDSEATKTYFGDPANHFWKVLSLIYGMPIETREEKIALCEKNQIAIWSIVKSCLRHMSREDTMQDIVLNDIQGFLNEHPTIQKILCVSHETKHLLDESNYMGNLEVEYVPSPSGADLYYEEPSKLVPRYKQALGIEE